MNTIYMPNFMQPYQQSIDMGLVQNFSAKVNGNKIDSYQIVIKKLDNTVIYDSGKVGLSSILYDKQTLTIPISGGVVTYYGQLKWILSYWNEAEKVSSGEMIFTNMTTPTIVYVLPSIINSKSHVLNVAYSQLENIPVKKWNIELYDIGDTLLQSSGDVYTSLINYTLEGLANNSSYYVCIGIETQSLTGLGIVLDVKEYFNVEYESLNIAFKPFLIEDEEKSAVKIDWSLLSQNPGVITGDFLYIDKYLREDNVGLSLKENSILTYSDFILPPNFTFSFTQQLQKNVDGIFFTTVDGNYQLGYNNVPFAVDSDLIYTGAWTAEVASGYHNGVAKHSSAENDNIAYSFIGTGINSHFVLSGHMGIVEIFIDNISQGVVDLYKDSSDYSYPTVEISDNIFTRQYKTFKSWNDVSTKTLNDLSTYNWEKIVFQHLFFSVENLIHGDHNIKINVTGTKNVFSDNTEIEFEYFELLNSETDNKFYSVIKGNTQYSETIKITDNPFIFTLFPNHVMIRQYNFYNQLNNILNYSWNDLYDFTLGFIGQ